MSARVMRSERWQKLYSIDGVRNRVTAIATAARTQLTDMMQLRADLERHRRQNGYDVDVDAALNELESIAEALEQNLALAMSRLPMKARTDVTNEVIGAAQTARERSVS